MLRLKCTLAMADEEVEYSAIVLPDDFPLLDDIVRICNEAGFCQNGVCIKVDNQPRYWTKYGGVVTLGEGLTQAHVAKIVNTKGVVRVPEVYAVFSRGGCRYIVMEHVGGTTFASRKSSSGGYDKKEVQAVADAVTQLVNIKLPAGSAPGPIGGGFIHHDFFYETRSTLIYPTVEMLEQHINKVCFPLVFSTSH